MRPAALIVAALLMAGLLRPAAAQGVLFQTDIGTNRCDAFPWPIELDGCPILLHDAGQMLSCRSTPGATWFVWRYVWTAPATIPPGQVCTFLNCTPQNISVVCAPHNNVTADQVHIHTMTGTNPDVEVPKPR